jgi:hypothetical protein
MQFIQAEYDRIKDMKAKHDILKAFKSATYEYSDYVNKDKIYKDLIVVLDQAVDIFAEFQSDMKSMFGRDVICDLKVKKNNG